jgi:VanZ family protein
MFNQKSIIVTTVIVFLIVLSMIFYFSSQQSKKSYNQSNTFLSFYESINEIFDFSNNKAAIQFKRILFDDLLEGKYTTPEAMIRKGAHFGIYYLFGGLCTLLMWLVYKKIMVASIVGLTLPVTIAVLDEFNQSFVDRTSSLSDVIGMITVLLLVLMRTLVDHIIKKNRDKKIQV